MTTAASPGGKSAAGFRFLRAMLWAISAFQRAAWRRPSNRRARPVHESGGMVEKYLTGSYAPRRIHGRRARRQLIAPLWQCQPSAGLGCRDRDTFSERDEILPIPGIILSFNRTVILVPVPVPVMYEITTSKFLFCLDQPLYVPNVLLRTDDIQNGDDFMQTPGGSTCRYDRCVCTRWRIRLG